MMYMKGDGIFWPMQVATEPVLPVVVYRCRLLLFCEANEPKKRLFTVT